MADRRPRAVRMSELKSKVLNTAKGSVFQVTLQPPGEVIAYLNSGSRRFNYSSAGESVELMCDSASLPGSSLFTHEVDNDYRGVKEFMAYRRDYENDLQLSFYVNQRYDVIEMFDGWMDFISGYDENQSQYITPYATYRMKYPEEYKTNIYVTKFEKNVGSKERNNNQPLAMEYTFVNAFPKSVQSTPVSYGDDGVLKYNVTLSYQRYVRRRRNV